ncbi:MAG TPA: hypothetical protein DF296_04715 [Candidatus Margulisbacteria bacterium]|nr:MAG: hypothetical protein A2X43_03290 [Candidatus Margulisbacteria bacterium GWD2_39_127]OGI04029.1 MAG: hypothetical protein A2X42_09060 [Candidatus Margulisbacteria bacterium GWF2_38_17]OGI11979.1 MAG: hypothetical protein A2X41_02935 [Candidatus Margulisbacteria bacterium GWE2_39_32]HAR63762.1 hypothetical protein [Candidatus Margulisiibacteriota bacterium]HCT84486.1 hypothetical protein [Candidatus Margulisiibacteriota bacterium]
MKERISFGIEFLFDSADRLLLRLQATWKDEEINLSLSTFLTFLSENENELAEPDAEFSYTLGKLLKKVSYNNEIIRAVTTDAEMAIFLKRARHYKISLYWNCNRTHMPITWSEVIPLTLHVNQNRDQLNCELADRQAWLNNPLAWLIFRAEKDLYIFSNGHITYNPSSQLLDFLDQFLDKEKIIFNSQQAVSFINNTYKHNKDRINWQIKADFADFVPVDDPPFPMLTITEKDSCLISLLSYKYREEIITPDFAASVITDTKTGRIMNRMKDLEDIYQQDIMDLFLEHNLPFMLRSPSDIARFLDKLIPVLRERDWIIHSDVPDYNIIDQPAELEFNIKQIKEGTIDWFYFEPACEINGQTFQLQELARLMVQNQGYVKTKSGYLKVTEKSREEINMLTQFGALKAGKKFGKAEILPLILETKVKGTDVQSKDLVHRIQHMNTTANIKPSSRFKGELRDYQQFGLNWLNFLHSAGMGGVLADDMGLGKTVQTIAFADQLKASGPCLVIGPTNVMYNWVKEIQKFAPHMNVIAYTGQDRFKHLEVLQETDFIISSFGVIKNDIDWFRSISFKAIFIDEAQYIKNPATQISKAVKSLNSTFKLAMTGTPIENHLQDLWNLFDFVMPDYLGTMRQFELALGGGSRDILKTKIRPFVLRREKKEVLLSLPEKTEIIMKCPMTEAQKCLYETVLKAGRAGIKNSTGKNERLNILTTLLKLRQVCIHPALLQELRGQDIPSSKFELAQEKISELLEEGHKIVLFTQFTNMLDIIEAWAKETGIDLYRIDGSVSGKKRMDIIDSFQNSAGSGLFIISLKAGGVGINLTAADYVIHLDPWWNPAIESQATDRVHRMGQKNKVIVYKLITEGTIEEKIQELQEQKRQLLAEIIDIDSLEDKKIDFSELRKILF